MVHQRNPLLRGQSQAIPWVRSLGSGKGRFAENTSPSGKNAKVEQRSLQLNPPPILSKGEVSSG